MFTIADRVKAEQNPYNMLRNSLGINIQLYTDRSHFVYELLQNAEDAEAKSIRFMQYPDRLEVFHDGKPFTFSNLKALCDIGKSDKQDKYNQIGKFGVGFKSVFGICDTVRLFSDPTHYKGELEKDTVPFAIEIKDFTRPETIEDEPLPKQYTTRFVFPFAVGRSFSGFISMSVLQDTLARKLQNLGITTLLFMKHLELIEYQIETDEEPVTGEYLLDKHIINNHCQLVSALGASEKGKADPGASEMISYLKFSRSLKKYPQRTVDIAFPIKVENGQYHCMKGTNPFVSVYFPTETESKLDFIVQGPYRTTPNRSSIPADDETNIMLAEETAVLLRESLIELKDLGKLNMSFVRALPICEDRFENFGLFLPLYKTVRELFKTAAIIPSKTGEYVSARFAKIARQEKLATVFPDDLLTQLVNDGNKYYWLPTFLTATNREYEPVFRFLSGELKIPVVPPEELRIFFASNPAFLPSRDNNWLVELYSIFANIPAAFSKGRPETNLLTSEIVKTSTGKFVAPFRKEGKSYIPNVFQPSPKIHSNDIHFVDTDLYQRCRYFFDGILDLKAPNEYECSIKNIAKRYENGFSGTDDQHIEDAKFLLKYVHYDDYSDEVNRIIKEHFVLKCSDGIMRSAHATRIFVPISPEGINIEDYYRDIGQTVYFVDYEFYELRGIDATMLSVFGVKKSIIIGENITAGTYETGSRGKQPDWWTVGDFRWKLSVDALKEVLKYISIHPTSNDSILKSKVIMNLLLINEHRLCGTVHIGGSTPDIKNAPCELIKTLCGEMYGWDGKWLFTESGELVAPKTVSKHDIDTSIYGRIDPNSSIFELLRFKKTEADEVDKLEKTIPKDQLEAYFKRKLLQCYGITPDVLDKQYGGSVVSTSIEENTKLPFPTLNVKNWDALKKHAAEMLFFANPVKYEDRVRSIRVSNHPRDIKAYLSNMYRHEGTYKYACQLCHETCSSFETAELFLEAEKELDPVHLCLCPNCATVYRRLRSESLLMTGFRNMILSKTEQDIRNEDHVAITIDNDNELWFTQTHFAEIQELMKLTDKVKSEKPVISSQPIADDKDAKSDVSGYSGLIGKTITQCGTEFVGEITDVIPSGSDAIVRVHVTGGENAGEDKKFRLSFIINKRKSMFSISDK